jgi:AcrR family transcriptional regulator
MARERKQNTIRKTAEELFSRYGTGRVTVQEICRTAGVSKVTFYKYFRNKDDLVRRIREDLLREGFAKNDDLSGQDISLPEKVELMTRWRREHFADLNDEFRRELFSGTEATAEVKKHFLANMTEARDKGEIRPDLSLDFLWLVTETLSGLVTDGSWKKVCSDYKDFQTQMRTLFFQGLLTRSKAESVD